MVGPTANEFRLDGMTDCTAGFVRTTAVNCFSTQMLPRNLPTMIGRRSVPPDPSRPLRRYRRGRERPRLRIAKVAPAPASGVAHAPVSVCAIVFTFPDGIR